MSKATVAIVGHGTSLKVNRLGYLIDAHDYVVRLKKGINLAREFPASYGTRTTHACLAVDVISGITDLASEQALYDKQEIWLYDNKHSDYNGNVVRESDLVAKWLARYNTIRESTYFVDFFSTGTASVLFACKRLNVPTITLFGFDAYRHPQTEYQNAFGKTLAVGHDWALERILIEEISRSFGTTLVFVE